jgi:hypothetical protein
LCEGIGTQSGQGSAKYHGTLVLKSQLPSANGVMRPTKPIDGCSVQFSWPTPAPSVPPTASGGAWYRQRSVACVRPAAQHGSERY